MGAFISLSESPFHGSLGRSRYPGEWDNQQVMSPTRVRFTPASGALSGVDTWFYYYRALNNLLSAGGVSQIGVKTAAVATFDGFNWNDQRAVNPVIVNNFPGAPAPVAGGTYNDFRAVVYNNKVRLFISIYDNPEGSNNNRTAIFESVNGLTFFYVGEATMAGGDLGRTIGAIANVGGTLVSLVSIANGAGGGNGRQKWISTDGGMTWLERGLAIPVGTEGDWNGLTYLGGTMELIGDYYVALLHGMPFIGYSSGTTPHRDWPEAFGAFRCHVDDILTADVIWESNAQNPLFIAGPTHGATWHAALYQHNGSTFAHMETWGVPGFGNIGNATNMALRDTPYFGVESRVSSAQIYMLEMKDRGWLDNWTMPILADGDYTLRHVASGRAGKFVGIVSGAPVPVINDEGEIAKFAVDRQFSYYRFRSGDVAMRAPSEFPGAAVVMGVSPGELTNQAGQWDLTPWGDPVPGGGRQVVITNRYTRMALSLANNTEEDGSPLVCLPFTGDPAQVFEIMPYRPSSTTSEWPDPENGMVNLPIGTGDIVTTTEPQNLANKTLELAGHTGTRAQLVTRAAAGFYANLADGAVIWADGYGYRKLGVSTDIDDMPGWVPHGDLSILQFASETVLAANAQPAINAMLAYAATLVEDTGLTLSRNGFSGKVKASLANRSWLVSSRVDMSQCAGVELCDGTLEANTATWPSSSTYVLRFGGINNNNNRYMGLRNVVVLCNRVANGILAENLQNSFADDVFIHGQTQYGWRKIGPKAGGCRMRNIRANEWFTSEAGYGEKANRTSIGISNECADETYENCEGVLCLINISLSGTGAHVFRQSHPFHGVMADLATYTVTGAVSDGATGTRCTVAATTGLSNGDLVVMPWINGISGEGGTGGRPGSYVISNVTGTTFDVAAYVFAGSFTGDDTPKVTLWSEEMVNLLINSDVSVADIDIEADNGKIKIVQDAAGSPRVKLRVLAAGLSANNARCAVELVADGVEADFAGVQVDIHAESSGYRLTAINGGTFADPIAAQVNEFRTDRASRSTALLSVGHGTATKPSLRFSGLDGGGAISTDANTGFFAHSDHTPALTVDGEEKLHFNTDALIPKNGYAIANTMTRAEFVAANAELASLPNGTVLFIGPLGFIKRAASSKIASAPGWDAMSPVRPEHFADNTVPGTTDMAPAIIAALAGYNECHLGLTSKTTTYFCASALGDVIDSKIIGANRDKTIIVFSSAIDPATPAIRLGRRSKITGLTLGYELAALTGTEAVNERVLVDFGPSRNALVKAAYGLDDVRLRRCGTALTSQDTAAFNYSITNIFIQTFTYKAWVLPVATGQTIDNIYIENGADYECQGAIEMQRRPGKYTSGSVASLGHINIHQCQTHGPLIMADGLDGVTLRAVHCEANAFLDADIAAFDFRGANVTFDNLEWIHSAWLEADQRLFMLRQGGQDTAATGYSVKTSRLRINNLWIQGLNQPNDELLALPCMTGFPNPSSITDPLAGAPTGFKFFGREVGATDTYIVELNNFSMHQYADSTYPQDKDFIRAIRANSDENIIFTSAAPVENFCPNGKLYGWLKTASAANNDEMAPGWIIRYSSGTLRGTRAVTTWQGKQIALLRADNTATTGNHHYVDYVIKDPWRFIGAQEMVLSFLAKVGVAAQTINRINLIRDDGAGGTVTELMIMGTQPELAFGTTLRRHQVNFVNALTAFTPAGLTPTVTIRFTINTTTPVTCDLYLGDLALEIGEQQTQSEV